MSVDWVQVKTDYLTGSMTMEEIASRHGIKHATVRARAAKEKWVDQRHKKQQRITELALEKTIPTRAAILAEFNEKDLDLAKSIKAKATAMLESCDSATELRQVAAATETAQKIARLALGVNTEEIKHDGGFSSDVSLTLSVGDVVIDPQKLGWC